MDYSIGSLEAHQLRALIEQYHQYQSDEDAVVMDIMTFKGSCRFQCPPTKDEVVAFGRALDQFISAARMLESLWTPEMENVVNTMAVDQLFPMSIDEWVEELPSIYPTEERLFS